MTPSNESLLAVLPHSATDAAGVARKGLWFLVLGLGSFLLWAGLAPLDQGMTGSGNVVVSGERKTVQSVLSGVVDTIRVREGDRVSKGQVLVQLNTIQAQSQLDVVIGQWLTARSLEARLIAERLDTERIDWPPGLLERVDDPRSQAAMNLQENLFTTRRAEQANRLNIIANEEVALRDQLLGYEEIKRNQEAQLTYQQQELEGLRKLAEEGYLPRNRLYDAERIAAQLSAQLASSLSDIARIRQAINENRLKTLQQIQTFRGEAEARLTEVSAQVSSLTEQLKALQFEVNNGTIVAPVSGQVIGLSIHTEGGVVPAGQPLMGIVPQGSPWLIKAHMPPMVIDRLKPGLPVDIRFGSLQRIKTPVLVGKVVTVSADQLIDETSKMPYFAVEVEPDSGVEQELRAAGLEVKPGMQAEIIIRTGERTLMNYLMRPITERLVGAFKEE